MKTMLCLLLLTNAVAAQSQSAPSGSPSAAAADPIPSGRPTTVAAKPGRAPQSKDATAEPAVQSARARSGIPTVAAQIQPRPPAPVKET